MRALIALALVVSPLMAAPAFADGIERPRRHVRHAPRPEPVLAGAADDIPVRIGPETVALGDGFLRGSDGGVGAQVLSAAYVGGGSTVIIRGGQATAIAIARASASASAGGFAIGGGYGGGCR